MHQNMYDPCFLSPYRQQPFWTLSLGAASTGAGGRQKYQHKFLTTRTLQKSCGFSLRPPSGKRPFIDHFH